MTGSTNTHQQDPRATRSPLTRCLRRTGRVVAVTGGAAAMVVLSATTSAAAPTCSDSTIIDVAVHGEHVVGDYVTGLGHDVLTWPPAGQVGTAVGSDGPAVVGGPGPGFHFVNGIAPGASFCVPQSSSPGFPHD
ncbi:MAG TPA: hypothetical protein VFZ64_11860 [Nocardioidaceae bacterium]